MHAIVRNYPPVVYQIASLYQELSDIDQASEWWDSILWFIYNSAYYTLYYVNVVNSIYFFTLYEIGIMYDFHEK